MKILFKQMNAAKMLKQNIDTFIYVNGKVLIAAACGGAVLAAKAVHYI